MPASMAYCCKLTRGHIAHFICTWTACVGDHLVDWPTNVGQLSMDTIANVLLQAGLCVGQSIVKTFNI